MKCFSCRNELKAVKVQCQSLMEARHDVFTGFIQDIALIHFEYIDRHELQFRHPQIAKRELIKLFKILFQI